ncbi:MAG: hypothetical protein FWE03_02715 [Firmicutes bacterium]|nr:hypothetical protein [Bacillota bacterium]
MKNKIKRSIVFLLVIALMFSLMVGLSGCSRYEFNKDDFRLVVTVDNAVVGVGDTVTVTAAFENLSGRRLRVRGMDAAIENLEEFIMIMIVPYGQKVGFFPRPVGGRIRRFTLRRGVAVEIEKSQHFRYLGVYQVHAAVAFLINGEYVIIHAELKTINIV